MNKIEEVSSQDSSLSNKIEDISLDPIQNNMIMAFALKNSNIGVWDYHAKTNMVYYSIQAIKILGFDHLKYDTRDFDWQQKIHPDDLEGLLSNLTAHYENKTEKYTSEHRVIGKDGTYKWVKDSGKIVERDSNGIHTRMIGTISDITDRMEREKSIENNLDIITNQNQKLTNFAHIVTHNLKEYAGNFESLLTFYEEAKDEEEKASLIEYLKTVSKSLTNTITSLKDIVTTQSIKKIERENLNVYNYIENTIKLLDIEIASKQAVFNNNVNKSIYLYCNAAYLESIVQNLASNALKYSHPDRQPIIDINSELSSDNQLTITVADNGIGIDLDKFGDKIFGLYKTFHGNENAQGVGLYLTKNQIEALGGKISVSSQVNMGTTFTITMTLTKNPA